MCLLKNVSHLFVHLSETGSEYVTQTSHEFMANIHTQQNFVFHVIFVVVVAILQISKILSFSLSVISDLWPLVAF